MKIKSIRNIKNDYCKCENVSSITTQEDSEGFGYWDICCKCGKRLEGEHHYYNHYDGEDHDDIDDILG